jgi:hypothetical protein
MPGTLEKAEAKYGDYWGDWTVDAGFYGLEKPGLAWVIESIKPNTEKAAKELVKLTGRITAAVRDKITPPMPGVLALVFSDRPHRHRLRAEKIDGGWRITEYDFRAWTFDIKTQNA